MNNEIITDIDEENIVSAVQNQLDELFKKDLALPWYRRFCCAYDAVRTCSRKKLLG